MLDDKTKLLISCNICEEWREAAEEIGAVRNTSFPRGCDIAFQCFLLAGQVEIHCYK